MNIDRILREVGKRLEDLPESERSEALDAIREEFVRERRRLDPSNTVEQERERRVEAETLRDVLEAINRQARLEETIEEVLRQLARLVTFDSCSIGLFEEGGCRILAVRGFAEPSRVVGLRYDAPILEDVRRSRWAVALDDAPRDPRFVEIKGTGPIRSWAGLPLVVEGEDIGILCLDRHAVDPFDEQDLHRARALAFSAAATIRKAQLLEQVRRYASLMEQVVEVDQAVFARKPVAEVARCILAGSFRIGNYTQGLLLLAQGDRHVIAAALGEGLTDLVDRDAPAMLVEAESKRLSPDRVASLALELGIPLPAHDLLLVPLSTGEASVGCLALFDPDGETPDDRLVMAYASRAATAYRHATLDRT